MTHDVQAFVGMLRDHLAAHDRPVSFLFGAGTSCSVKVDPTGFRPLIPDVNGMTSTCKEAVDSLGETEAKAWESALRECDQVGLPANVESLLSRVRMKLEALGPDESSAGLTRQGWAKVDLAIRKQIARTASPPAESIPSRLPHNSFATWVRNATRRRPVEVFTTNYDVLFELSFDRARVPHFDGFIGSQFPYFSPETVENDDLMPSPAWLRFWKLHGSVTWVVENLHGENRITRGKPSYTGEMVLPSHKKYDESRKQPYRSLMDRLSRVLARQDSLMIVCGFSFNDQHINAVILDAVEQNPSTHVVVLSYTNVAESDRLTRWAEQFPNIVVAGPSSGVISGRYGEWSVSSKVEPHLEAATGGLIRVNSNSPEEFSFVAGDFSSLCSFMEEMSSRHGRAGL